MLTQERARELFEYHEDGYLTWKEDRGVNKTKGQAAGWYNDKGYYHIFADSERIRGHVAVFLFHHGYIPKSIDHRDRNPSNNRIENLRPATVNQQAQNQRSREGSSSVYKGVSYHKAKGNWRAYIQTDKKLKYLGSFDCECDAAQVYNFEAAELHGEFAVLNEHPDNLKTA